MDIEVKDKANRRHVGHNLQKIRVYFGMKQEALAADLGVNQQVISKIEKQEEIEEGLLNQIASVLGISAEVIKDFDVEKAIYNINNIRDNTFEQGSTSIAQQFNPVDKIVELYERLLQSEREKVELLKNKFIIMETESYTNNSHLGRKIERIRRLRGMTQTDLGELLGVTKQAISKMEQSEKIDDDKLKQVADALGVTEDGLKKFTEETVLYSTNNFYENCHVSASNIGPITHVENLNHFSMEQAVKLFEELLKIEREKYSKGKEDSK